MLHRVNHLHGIGRTEPKYLYLRFEIFVPEADIVTMQRTIHGAEEMIVRAVLPLYEGDSIVHYGANVALPRDSSQAPETAERSALAVIGDAIRGFFLRLERRADRLRYRELENYLAESGDVYELERRMREVERSRGSSFNRYS